MISWHMLCSIFDSVNCILLYIGISKIVTNSHSHKSHLMPFNSFREMGSVGVMPLPDVTDSIEGSGPAQPVGLSLPETLNESLRVTYSMCNPVREIRMGGDKKKERPCKRGRLGGNPTVESS